MPGIKILTVTPPYLKFYNQYVKCRCTTEEKEELLTELNDISGVTHATLVPCAGIIIIIHKSIVNLMSNRRESDLKECIH
jgi:hypothetical protein